MASQFDLDAPEYRLQKSLLQTLISLSEKPGKEMDLDFLYEDFLPWVRHFTASFEDKVDEAWLQTFAKK